MFYFILFYLFFDIDNWMIVIALFGIAAVVTILTVWITSRKKKEIIERYFIDIIYYCFFFFHKYQRFNLIIQFLFCFFLFLVLLMMKNKHLLNRQVPILKHRNSFCNFNNKIKYLRKA